MQSHKHTNKCEQNAHTSSSLAIFVGDRTCTIEMAVSAAGRNAASAAEMSAGTCAKGDAKGDATKRMRMHHVHACACIRESELVPPSSEPTRSQRAGARVKQQTEKIV
eukprot:6192760-Pleurochrysis_carterae.AAC.3